MEDKVLKYLTGFRKSHGTQHWLVTMQVQAINNKLSSESTVIVGVPQGSIDGLLLLDLFINGLVSFIQYCTVSNSADDNNNLFSIGKNNDQVKTFLSSDFKIINNWFYVFFYSDTQVKNICRKAGLKLSVLLTLKRLGGSI